MASFGQSISQARQYQHSSNFMCALRVAGLTARQSTGHESMQMRHPVMQRLSSTTTGTSKRCGGLRVARGVGRGRLDALAIGDRAHDGSSGAGRATAGDSPAAGTRMS